MSFVNGRRVVDLEVAVPPAGAWIATGHLDHGAPLPAGPATIRIGDLELVGTVPAGEGGLDSPDFPAFTIRGGAGWQTPLTAASYASGSSVRLTTVLRDLAALAGETVDLPEEALLGPGYGWDGSTPERPVRAASVLAELVARGVVPLWRVAPNGHTRFDPWPARGAADGLGTVVDRDLAGGTRYVALDGRAAAFLPGGTLEGQVIRRVAFRERDSELRADVGFDTSPPSARSFRAIVLQLFPWLARFGLAADGALQVRSAAGRTELEGGGPAVLRVGDVGRLVFDPGVPLTGVAPALYYAPASSGTFRPVATVTVPGSTTGGTMDPLTAPYAVPTLLGPTGSSKVTCG